MIAAHQTVLSCSVTVGRKIKCSNMPQSAYDESMQKYFKPHEFDQSIFNFPPEPQTEKTHSIDQLSNSLDQQPISQIPSVTTGIFESTLTDQNTQGTWIWDQKTVDSASSETPTISSTISTFFENVTSAMEAAGTTKEDNFIVGQESSATNNSTVLNTTVAIDELFGNNSTITEIIDTTTDTESNVTDVITYVNHTMRDIGNNTDTSTGDQAHVHSAVVIMCVVVGLFLALIVVGCLVYYFNKSKLACGESKLNFFQQRDNHTVQNNESIVLADSSRPVQDSYHASRL